MADAAFNGPCPFLTCTETKPHKHAACPDCGAVRYGNPYHCPTCNTVCYAEMLAHRADADPIPLFPSRKG